MERSEGDMSLKNPVTPPGIDPGTIRLVEQRLSHYATPGLDINRAWENNKDNFKISSNEGLGLYELKHHKQWFDVECLGFLDQRKQANLQCYGIQNQSSIDNPNNVRCETSRHASNKKKENLKAKIYELETNSNIKTIRDLYSDISYFKRSYKPTANV